MALNGFKVGDEVMMQVVVEAAYFGDEPSCAKYGVSARTLQRYRRRLATDGNLAKIVARKREAFDREWALSLNRTIGKAASAIEAVSDEIAKDPKQASKNPAILEALAKALYTCASVKLANRVIDARIFAGRFDAEDDEDAPRQLGDVG
jgi:hypothetical protein